jgi:hypothetical protein
LQPLVKGASWKKTLFKRQLHGFSSDHAAPPLTQRFLRFQTVGKFLRRRK